MATSAISDGERRYDEIAAFIARFQAEPTTHCAYVGFEPNEIEASLREFDVRFVLHERDGIESAIGIDYDEELRRAWLYGPFSEAANWDASVERLYEAVLEHLASDVRELEVGFNERNDRVAAFAQRHGFREYSRGALMRIERAQAEALPDVGSVVEMRREHEQDVRRLHELSFPDVWPTSAQLVTRIDERHRLLVAADEQVRGYIYLEADPEHGEGAIEFIAVNEASRGRGVGTALLTAGVAWLFSFDSIATIELFVRDDNPAAQRIYAKAGFRQVHRLIGARKAVD